MSTPGQGDPFDEHADEFARPTSALLSPSEAPDTLAVGRLASLSLGEDTLVVLDEAFVDNDSKCCGLLPGKTKTTRSIPLYNVLWADLAEFDISIHYARQVSPSVVRPAFINYTVDKDDRSKARVWIEKLLDRAYGASQRQKRIKVLVNPFGGQGGAQRMYTKEIEPIFAAARCVLDVEETQFSGHAVELVAENIEADDWDVIACCSGDGVPHEVFNGLGKRRDAARALQQIAVVQLPCGSGNGMSLNLNGTNSCSMAALAVVKGLRTPMDLVSITQGDRRTLSFLSQSVGIVAECDLATENLRWMGGQRFTYGFLVRIIGQTIYPCDVAVGVEIESKAAIKEAYAREAADPPQDGTKKRQSIMVGEEAGLPPLRYGTVNDPLPESWTLTPYDKMGNFYCGNMAYMSADANFFQAALPSDGCLDMVNIDGDIPRTTSIKTLLAVEKGNFFDLPHVNYRKVTGYRIIPKNQEDGYISIDGERVPFEPFQAEVHKGLGTVLSKTGHLYEARGPPK
ncbi:sphinganine kinase lcb4 [Botryosphaeria dothidea]